MFKPGQQRLILRIVCDAIECDAVRRRGRSSRTSPVSRIFEQNENGPRAVQGGTKFPTKGSLSH